jgi:uncharacterized protein YjbI with pentapeptide repeats
VAEKPFDQFEIPDRERYYISVIDPISKRPTEVETYLEFDGEQPKSTPCLKCDDRHSRLPALPNRRVCWVHLGDKEPWLREISRELEYKMTGKSVPRVVNQVYVGCDFPAVSLYGIQFVSTVLTKVRINDARWKNVTFVGSKLRGVDFANCLIENLLLKENSLVEYSTFVNCRVAGLRVLSSRIQNVAFLSKPNLPRRLELIGEYANIEFNNLHISSDAILQELTFENVTFRNADLIGVDMSRCIFVGTNVFDKDCALCDTRLPESYRSSIVLDPAHVAANQPVFSEPTLSVQSSWERSDPGDALIHLNTARADITALNLSRNTRTKFFRELGGRSPNYLSYKNTESHNVSLVEASSHENTRLPLPTIKARFKIALCFLGAIRAFFAMTQFAGHAAVIIAAIMFAYVGIHSAGQSTIDWKSMRQGATIGVLVTFSLLCVLTLVVVEVHRRSQKLIIKY